MKAEKLRAWIDSLSQDIDFEYHGRSGAICPFSHSEISLVFEGREVTVGSVDAAMSEPFIDGYSLAELCEELTL